MIQPLCRLALTGPADVVAARLAARRLAEDLGFDRPQQTRIATAVSEIVRNAQVHGRGGRVRFEFAAEPVPRFVAVVEDDGPGIAALDAVLAGRQPAQPGRGNGLPSARRLVDEFEIESSSAGTVVRLGQRLPRAALAALTPARLAALARALPPPAAVDALAALREQERELVESLTDLQERQAEASRLNRELEETNRGVVALYSELDQKAEELRTVSELKSRFLSHMSHEFRTPLNSILALSRLLLDGVDGALGSEQARQVEYIQRSAHGLLEMVNDLLDLAKVEAGKVEVKPIDFTIADLFASLRGSLRPLLVNPAVELRFDDPAGLPRAYADEAKVAQVLRNFVSNALKFTERGSVCVSASHDAASGTLRFAVTDTGIGIEAQHLERVFEEFTQIDGRLQRGGTGLGLPLSRRLAMLMGGHVGVRRTPDRGSTFELTLPLRYGEPDAAPAAPGALRVLVVDDEEAFRYIVRHIAQDAGYGVLEAADGEAGFAAIKAHRPDLVVLDLHMPVLDGYGLLARLADSDARATPVIVCSSQRLTVEQKRALASAYAILSKQDVSRQGLLAQIDAALRRGRSEAADLPEPSA